MIKQSVANYQYLPVNLRQEPAILELVLTRPDLAKQVSAAVFKGITDYQSVVKLMEIYGWTSRHLWLIGKPNMMLNWTEGETEAFKPSDNSLVFGWS